MDRLHDSAPLVAEAVYHSQDFCCKLGLCHTRATTIDSMASRSHQGQPCWPAQSGNRCQGSHTLPALVEGYSMASLLSCTVAHKDASSQECPSQDKDVVLCHQDHPISLAHPRRGFVFSPPTRVVAWIFRFYHNSCKTGHRKTDDIITTSEVTRAKTRILLRSQQESFEDVLEALWPLLKGHVFARLLLVKDEDGLLQVSSRVREPASPKNPKRLILLSIQSDLTRLLIKTLRTTYGYPSITVVASILNDIYYFWRKQVKTA